jgi:hypothetical protein
MPGLLFDTQIYLVSEIDNKLHVLNDIRKYLCTCLNTFRVRVHANTLHRTFFFEIFCEKLKKSFHLVDKKYRF